MKFRTQHFPQIPCKPFIFECATFEEADQFNCLLAAYDLFLLENNHRCDYANAQTIQYFDEEEKEWIDYNPAEWEV